MATEFLQYKVRFGTIDFLKTKLDNMALLSGSRAEQQSKRLRRWGKDTIRESDVLAASASQAAFSEHNKGDVAVRRELRKYQEKAWRTGELGDARAETIYENPSDHYLFGGANPHMPIAGELISAEWDATPNQKAWNAYSQRGEHYKGAPEQNVDSVKGAHGAHPKEKRVY